MSFELPDSLEDIEIFLQNDDPNLTENYNSVYWNQIKDDPDKLELF